MATRSSPEKRRRLRALEAQRDALQARRDKALLDLKKVRTEIKAHRAKKG
jgi:hypothetical protein